MSIRPILWAREGEGRIEQLSHTLLGKRTPRVIYLTRNVFDQLMGPWDDATTATRMGMLHADLDRFLEGGLIIVGHRRSRHAYMKRFRPRTRRGMGDQKPRPVARTAYLRSVCRNGRFCGDRVSHPRLPRRRVFEAMARRNCPLRH